jgi:signal transduction histidine kinase
MASLGQLAAGVAHEINNPVGYVMSNLRTLAEYIDFFKSRISGGDVDDELQSVIEDAVSLVDESTDGMLRVTEIVDGLKRFARADDASEVEVDINELIDVTLRVLKNELKYNCVVETHLADLPKVTCNPGQINQVLMNLFVNAKQAIRDRGTISISTTFESDDDGGCVRIRVTDTGSGIPPENLTRLFNPFFTTKPVGQGTGLGLSITYSIVKHHGGAIEVESQEDVGTTFTVTLPVRPAALVAPSPTTLRAA